MRSSNPCLISYPDLFCPAQLFWPSCLTCHFSSNSLVESVHGYGYEGGTVPLDAQLFASAGAIRFPISPVTEAWKEKVGSITLTIMGAA